MNLLLFLVLFLLLLHILLITLLLLLLLVFLPHGFIFLIYIIAIVINPS